jgi:hypothetical protein
MLGDITTPLWSKCEDEICTPKSGNLESSDTLKTSKLDCRNQTLFLEVFFIPLQRFWSVDVEMASHEPFGHLQHKLWLKEGSRVKLAIWLPTTKSQESTRPRCVQVECDKPLERSWGELQVCFRPHPNQRSELGIMSSQSLKSLNRDNFETPPWESQD